MGTTAAAAAAAAAALQLPLNATHKPKYIKRHTSSGERLIIGAGSHLQFCKGSIFFSKFTSHHPLNSTLSIGCSSLAPGAPADDDVPLPQQNQDLQANSMWKTYKNWMKQLKSGEMSAKMAKLGLAAVLAYGLLDGVTYTTFFVLAFLGYEKSTGKNPAANLQALIGMVILMWTGNNITRPFRVAGAAALAPAVDKGLKRIQKQLNLPGLVYAFALVVGAVAASCLTVLGLLILSRWRK